MALEENFAKEIGSAVDTAVADAQSQLDDSQNKSEEGNNNGTAANPNGENESSGIGSGNASNEGDNDGIAGASPPADGGGVGQGDGGANGKVPEKPVSSISDSALTQAVNAGFTIGDARKFVTDDNLLSAIARVRELSSRQAIPNIEEDIFAGLPKFEDSEEQTWEPEVKQAFESLKGIIKRQQEAIEGLKSHTQSTVQLQQDAQRHEVEQWFDKQIASLGDDFKDALGTGSHGSLDKASPQFAKREAIANRAAVLLAGYKASGQQSPPRDEVFQAAAKLELMDEYQKIREKKISGELANRSTQHINRAGGSNRNKGNSSPLEATAAILDAKFFPKGR